MSRKCLTVFSVLQEHHRCPISYYKKCVHACWNACRSDCLFPSLKSRTHAVCLPWTAWLHSITLAPDPKLSKDFYSHSNIFAASLCYLCWPLNCSYVTWLNRLKPIVVRQFSYIIVGYCNNWSWDYLSWPGLKELLRLAVHIYIYYICRVVYFWYKV